MVLCEKTLGKMLPVVQPCFGICQLTLTRSAASTKACVSRLLLLLLLPSLFRIGERSRNGNGEECAAKAPFRMQPSLDPPAPHRFHSHSCIPIMHTKRVRAQAGGARARIQPQHRSSEGAAAAARGKTATSEGSSSSRSAAAPAAAAAGAAAAGAAASASASISIHLPPEPATTMYSSGAPPPPAAGGPAAPWGAMAPPAAAAAASGAGAADDGPQGFSPLVNPPSYMEIEGSRRFRRRPGRGPPPPKTTLAAALMLVGGIVSRNRGKLIDQLVGWVVVMGWNEGLGQASHTWTERSQGQAPLTPTPPYHTNSPTDPLMMDSTQILLSVGLGIRWSTDPKEQERGLALIILGSISTSLAGLALPCCITVCIHTYSPHPPHAPHTIPHPN